MCQLLVAIDDGEDTRRKTAFRSLHSVNMHATALGSLTNGISGAKSSVDIAVVLAAARARSFLTAGAFKQLLLGGLACASSHCFARKFLRGRSEVHSYASLHSHGRAGTSQVSRPVPQTVEADQHTCLQLK